MSAPSRLAPTVCRFCRASPAWRRTFASSATTTHTTTTTTTTAEQSVWPQRQPRGEYYDILLRDPTPYGGTKKAEQPPSSSPLSEAKSTTTTTTSSPARTYETISSRTAYSDANNAATTAAERARVIFGSRLLGPAERADRAAGRQAQSTLIAGVRVPPRPEEPDNCCMSGCVNCVWDLFREEMEEWTLQAREAKTRLAAAAAAEERFGGVGLGGGVGGVGGGGGEQGGVGGAGGTGSSTPATTMDDAGGSETNWAQGKVTSAGGGAKIAQDMWTDDVFQNVPVGIREFMKQEKRLKEKHQREGTSGG